MKYEWKWIVFIFATGAHYFVAVVVAVIAKQKLVAVILVSKLYPRDRKVGKLKGWRALQCKKSQSFMRLIQISRVCLSLAETNRTKRASRKKKKLPKHIQRTTHIVAAINSLHARAVVFNVRAGPKTSKFVKIYNMVRTVQREAASSWIAQNIIVPFVCLHLHGVYVCWWWWNIHGVTHSTHKTLCQNLKNENQSRRNERKNSSVCTSSHLIVFLHLACLAPQYAQCNHEDLWPGIRKIK